MSIRRVKPWHRSTEQQYRLRGWRRWLMWWMFLPMLLGGLLLVASATSGTNSGADSGAGAAGAVLLLLAGTVLAGWEWLWRRTTLELSTAGLRLRQLGYTLETPWSNIAGFHAEAGHEGFLLAQPLDTADAQRLAAFSGMAGQYSADQAGWIASRRFIPIEAFGWHLRRGALATDVAARAPHLAPVMQEMNAPAPPKPASAPAERRRNILLWLFIGVLVVASGVLAWTQPAGLGRAIDLAYAVLAPLAVLQAGLSTWQFARGRQWGMALLMTAATLVALGWCAAAWQHLG